MVASMQEEFKKPRCYHATQRCFENEMQISNTNSQQGAALIMALLLLAIVAAIATSIMFSQQVDIQTQILQNTANQARLDNNYAIIWWQNQWQQLQSVREKQQQMPTWPQQLSTTTLANGDTVTATVMPANARFNLNNLAVPISPYLTLFTNLIIAVDPNFDPAQAQKVSINLQQWLTNTMTGPNQTNPYLNYQPPYQAAHQPMVSASELRLVQGVTADLYRRLRPYIIALPTSNIKVDVNAAKEKVLLALFDQNNMAVQQVLEYRRMYGSFLTASAFFGLDAVGNILRIPGQQLKNFVSTEPPQYFLVHSVVKHDKINFNQDSLLQFDPKQQTMAVIQQGQDL